MFIKNILGRKKAVLFLSITLGLIALHAVGPHEAAEGALLRGVYQANHEQLQWRFSANQGKLCFQKTLTPCAGSVLGDLSWAFDPAQNNYRLKTLCLSRTSSGTHAENSDDVLTHQQLASHMKCHLENLFRFVGVSHDPLPLPLSDEAPLLALWSQYDIKLHHLAEQRGLQNRTQDFNFF